MNETMKLIVTLAVFVILLIGGLVGLYFQMAFVGTPPFKGAQSLATQIERQEARITAAKAKIDQIPQRMEELAQLDQAKRDADQLLPRETTPDALLAAINAKAEQTGVTPKNITPTLMKGGSAAKRGGPAVPGASSGGNFDEWRFDISLEGSYDQIGQFVNKMEEFEILGKDAKDRKLEKRFFAVRDLDILIQSAKGVEELPHQCRLTMVTYRYAGDEKDTAGP